MPLIKYDSKTLNSMRKQFSKTNWAKVFYSTTVKDVVKDKSVVSKPHGNSPMGVKSMPMMGEPNSSKFSR